MHALPMTQREAFAYIREHHRHLRPPRGDLFRVAAVRSAEGEGSTMLGVIIVGRPVSRVLQDGTTCEVLRLATEGGGNVCSFLYGKAARIARELGYRRIYTYTLASEPGTSLRAAGWVDEGIVTSAREWDCPSRPRDTGVLPQEAKRRWRKDL